MLDDGQSQASTTGVARPAAIDAVETLRQSRQMVTRDTDAIVSNLDLAATIHLAMPGNLDQPTGRRIAHRVLNQISHCTEQFGLKTSQFQIRRFGQFDLVPAGRQGAGVTQHPVQQRNDTHPAISWRPRAAF